MYSIISLMKFVIMLFLSKKCEVEGYSSEDSTVTDTSSLLHHSDIHEEDDHDDEVAQMAQEQQSEGWLSTAGLSPETRYYLPRFLAIFMLDSLGYGFMPSAWVVYYFKIVFTMSATGLGTLFFITNAIDSISSLPSAYFAKALGPVRAMIFTQAPSAVFFILIAISLII